MINTKMDIFVLGGIFALISDCYANDNVVNPDALKADCEYLTAYNNNPRPLTSSGYPNGYESYTNQCWIIQAFHTLDYVNVTFDDIDIESSLNCTKDQLLVRDGTVFESNLLFSHCGTLDHRKVIQSSGGYLLIVFVTDGQVQSGRGFKITYQSHDTGIERNSSERTRNIILLVLLGMALFSFIMGLILMCVDKQETDEKPIIDTNSRSNSSCGDTRSLKMVHEPVMPYA